MQNLCSQVQTKTTLKIRALLTAFKNSSVVSSHLIPKKVFQTRNMSTVSSQVQHLIDALSGGPAVLGMGNPLLDISSPVKQEFFDRFFFCCCCHIFFFLLFFF